MQRARLTDVVVRNTRRPGYHLDGGGLYLQVAKGGTKSWIFRYRSDGRLRDMGLGSVADVSLAEARRKASKLRQQRLDGIDPLQARRAERTRALLDAAKAITFDDASDAYIRDHEAGWSNAKHGQQWRNTLKVYASPVIGKLPVAAIDTGLVLQVLKPIWPNKTETASRVRQRIERVLNWAILSDTARVRTPPDGKAISIRRSRRVARCAPSSITSQYPTPTSLPSSRNCESRRA